VWHGVKRDARGSQATAGVGGDTVSTSAAAAAGADVVMGNVVIGTTTTRVLVFTRVLVSSCAVLLLVLTRECVSLAQLDRLSSHEALVASRERVVRVSSNRAGQQISALLHVATYAGEKCAEVGQGLGVSRVYLYSTNVLLLGGLRVSVNLL